MLSFKNTFIKYGKILAESGKPFFFFFFFHFRKIMSKEILGVLSLSNTVAQVRQCLTLTQNTSMHIFPTALHTFFNVLKRRVWLIIRNFCSW